MNFFGRMSGGVFGALLLASVNGCSLSDSGQLDEENEPHFIAGKNSVNALDYSAAIEAFNESLAANPHSAAAHYQLACLFDSGEKVADPAAAIYHYQEFLRLKPRSEKAGLVAERVQACKVSLANDVTSLPSMPGAQKLLEALSATNRILRAEVTQWRAYYANQAATASQTPTPVANENSISPTTHDAASANVEAPVKIKTHVIASGESLAMIARKAHVSLAALEAANPKVNPKKLRVGQTINLPPQ